jgi:asparagine synthase (glutamine-hydrolysing)
LHAGQPFADTSIFAVHEICRLLRQFVKVALSGDGGDEGFGGYHTYSDLMRIVRGQTIPPLLWQGAAKFLESFGSLGRSEWWARQIRSLMGADDIAIVQYLFCWIREEEHKNLCRDMHLLPIRRLFEPEWEYRFPSRNSRLERLSAHVTELNVRLKLANDYLFKVDTASMRQSLEIRVPMLDEDLFDFGLSLPHNLKANKRVCKRVLREVSRRYLPPAVANKPKMGFGIPVDKWVDSDFKRKLKEALLGPSSCLPEYFHPGAYRPIIEAFCEGRSLSGVSREGLYQRVIMLLSVDLAHQGRVA